MEFKRFSEFQFSRNRAISAFAQTRLGAKYLLVGKTKRQGYFQSFDVVQCVSGGKLFEITRSDLFVNFLDDLILEKNSQEK